MDAEPCTCSPNVDKACDDLSCLSYLCSRSLLYWSHIGIMENKMETAIWDLGLVGVI